MSAPDPARGRIGILTALPEERAALAARMRLERHLRLRPLRVALGRLGPAEVALAITGDGPIRAERGARAVLESLPLVAIVGTGIAGGLSHGLGVGSVLVAGSVVSRGAGSLAPDPEWLARALAALPEALRGTLVASDRLLCSSASKRDLARELAPDAPAAAVDMESLAWAQVATRAGVPWLIIRAVSDAPDDELPPFLASCQRADLSLSRSRILAHALFRPGAWRDLISLRRRARLASAAAASCVARLLASSCSPPAPPALPRRTG